MARGDSPHIGLYGQCGFGNFGNDATLEVVLNHLRQTLPGARFTAIVRVPPVVESNLGVRAIPFYPAAHFPPHGEAPPVRVLSRIANEVMRIGEAAKEIGKLDYIVFAGGGRFDDFNAKPLQQPFWKWKWIGLARLLGVPVEYTAIGAGPVDHALSRWFYTMSGRMARARSFRDEESRLYTRDVLHIDTSRDPLYTDLVFARPPPAAAPPSWPARTIGLGVMEYSNRRGERGGAGDIYPSYIERLTKLASSILARGQDLRIIVGETCDMSTAIDLYRRLSAADLGERVTLNAVTSYDEAAAEIAKCDVLIATRFHNVVAALSCGRPVISLGYASKNDRLMEEFGLGEFCAHIDNFDPDEVVARLSRLSERGAQHTARVAAQARLHARLAQDCLDDLTARIAETVARPAAALRQRPSRALTAR